MNIASPTGSGAARAAPAKEPHAGDDNGPVAILPWQVFVSELIGTALLVLVGLSLVIVMFGDGSPIIRLLPDEGLRRLITGFLFDATGALIVLSPVGMRRGAHISPIVMMAVRLMGKPDLRTSLGYVVAQLAGEVLGALPLLAWGSGQFPGWPASRPPWKAV